MRIAVIGAGIAGLVAAAGLQKAGHEVTVHERSSNPHPVGAGLTLFGNSFEALDLVGLGDAVRDASTGTIGSMRAGQRTPSGRWMTTAPPATSEAVRSIHRSDLHRVLIDSLRTGTLHMGSPATVSTDGAPRIVAAGQSEDVDLVIVADGIHSSNRRILGLDTGLHYAGYTAWRGVTGTPVDVHHEAGETWGRGQIFGIVPLPDHRIYWFGTLNCPAGSTFPDEHAEVRRRFTDWHPPIQECIEATPPDALLRHDIYDLAAPLPSLVKGRTAVIGDAAHAMTPNLGQGAGQGIEDAATLTVLLRDASPDALESTLVTYDELRRPRTTSVMRGSRTAGRVAQASNPLLAGLRDGALLLTPARALTVANNRLVNWPRPA